MVHDEWDALSGPDLGEVSAGDAHRWLRDMSALLALPALWVDHEPREIATGLLSVLFSVLRLDGAYARFEDPEADEPLEVWRPSGPRPPAELLGLPVPGGAHPAARVAAVPLALPWETGTVLVSAARRDFPTTTETQLLHVAVGQAAIAIHTARRLAREGEARRAAEHALHRQQQLLRSLVDELAPELAALARRVDETGQASGPVGRADTATEARVAPSGAAQPTVDLPRSGPLALTHREVEVLGLLAQGLSNKEIAGVLWLSDRTVERHITSLYRKIGVARRSEATAFALRHGVV